MSASRPFTSLVVSNEITVLRRLHGMLIYDPIASREQFGDLMKAAFEHCKLDPRQLANDVGFSISTVYRWADGRTAPHASLWPTIVAWVRAAIERKVEEAEATVESPSVGT